MGDSILSIMPLIMVVLPLLFFIREIEPIVSSNWLAEHLEDKNLRIIDIRPPEVYKKGHVPRSVNTPIDIWAVNRNGLVHEIPDARSLEAVVRSMGLEKSSRVVAVGSAETVFNLADTTRLAWTLKSAGIDNIAVLDGGYNQWDSEQNTISRMDFHPSPTTFKLAWRPQYLADKAYVMQNMGRVCLVDARDQKSFNGSVESKKQTRGGHIPGAINLPLHRLFNGNGTFKSTGRYKNLLQSVIKDDQHNEIIIYCGVGTGSTALWFVLSELLGYRHVKVYDGSMDEWAKDLNCPLVC